MKELPKEICEHIYPYNVAPALHHNYKLPDLLDALAMPLDSKNLSDLATLVVGPKMFQEALKIYMRIIVRVSMANIDQLQRALLKNLLRYRHIIIVCEALRKWSYKTPKVQHGASPSKD